jgi:hypothetical protein
MGRVNMCRSKRTWLVLALASCAGNGQSVRPDDMSAARHHDEARREELAAHRETDLYDPGVVPPSLRHEPTGDDWLHTVPVYGLTERHLAKAEEHREHARQHEAAAQFLERSEEVACREIAPAERAACPLLGPVVAITDIGGGVRVRFQEGTRVEALFARMRCHYAFARARAFVPDVACPLYVRGIDIQRAVDPMAIDITAESRAVAREIRARSRDEALYVSDDLPGK